jgi:hypothetical protein
MAIYVWRIRIGSFYSSSSLRSDLLWIAEEALMAAELPSGWGEHVDGDGNAYYWRTVGPEKGVSTYENPIDTHHKELYSLHLVQKRADEQAAEDRRAAAANGGGGPKYQYPERAAPTAMMGARDKCGDAFWWGAAYKGWLAKKSGTEGSSKMHLRRKWEKRYFALQGNRLL